MSELPDQSPPNFGQTSTPTQVGTLLRYLSTNDLASAVIFCTCLQEHLKNSGFDICSIEQYGVRNVLDYITALILMLVGKSSKFTDSFFCVSDKKVSYFC